jgi:hypothetical protein
MTVESLAPQLVQPPSGPLTRPARALIGWLPEDSALSLMVAPGVQPPFAPAIVARVAQARAAVAARAPVTGQKDVITDAPAELAGHIAELESQPFYRIFLAEGWRVKIANLLQVRAVQPLIHTDHAQERTVKADSSSVLSLAEITIPTSRPKELLAMEPSSDGRRWTLTCRNPMLRILGLFQQDLVDDNGYKTKAFGFQIEIAHSLVQVARWRGNYLLRDGYHRAHGLLSRGITSAPVVYREFPDDPPPIVAPGLFEPSVYLSDRPPFLMDFLDDSVSVSIENRKTQKLLWFRQQNWTYPSFSSGVNPLR